jgi:2-polyprenyl-3-methyl-5-hydroxy-6-metoxy-1,4-benzoquinol methylase
MPVPSTHSDSRSLSLDVVRAQLIRLAPELEEMAMSLPRQNPDYEEVIATPLRLISFLCEDSPENMERAAQGYIKFCHTFQDKQLDFVRNGAYAETDFEHVNEEVYQNIEYMSNVYYPALLFSYLFSSNYFGIYQNFRNLFLPLAQSRSGASLEVGVGHGLLSGSLLNSPAELVGYGLDISPAAVQVSSRVSAFFKLARPISTIIGDAVEHIPLANGAKYQVMICAEVLEHLPDPARLLRNMHAALEPGGILFLTASINMESVDHLYLFRMVEECGFKLVNHDLAFLTAQPYRNNPKIIESLKRRARPATAIVIASKM